VKNVDWTPGFSSRSLKGWLKAGVPGNSGVFGAVKNAFTTGSTSTERDIEKRQIRKFQRTGRTV
jgi:hypothetical protein